MGFDIVTLTLVHVALSMLAIFAGLVVSGGFIAGRRLDGWTGVYLVTTALTNITGFLFPFTRFLPAHGVGVVSLLVLPIVLWVPGAICFPTGIAHPQAPHVGGTHGSITGRRYYPLSFTQGQPSATQPRLSRTAS